MTRADSVAKPWVVSLTGLLSAVMMAAWMRPPLAGLSLAKAIAASAGWLLTTMVAGALGVCAGQSVIEGVPARPPLRFLVTSAATWALIPPILMFWVRGSAGAAFLGLVAGAITAAGWWGVSQRGQVVEDASDWVEGPRFAALPAPDSGRSQAFAIALCAEVALVLMNRDAVFLATLLMGIAGFLFAWKRLVSIEANVCEDMQESAARTSAAVVLAILILIPLFMAHLVRNGSIESQAQAAARTHADREKGSAAYAFQGIVLFTVEEKKEVLPPLPMERDLLRSGMTRPLVIRFDGSYWYFQAPEHGPGAHPHLTHGDPVAVSIYSTGRVPLAMQAHQTLTQPVDLRPVGAMQVTVRNGDNRVGRIDMGILLADSTAPGKPTLYLGTQPIVSTEPDHFAVKTNPVTETISYTIPERRAIRKFDEVTVLFFPDAMRMTLGARVGIQQFEFMPR